MTPYPLAIFTYIRLTVLGHLVNIRPNQSNWITYSTIVLVLTIEIPVSVLFEVGDNH